LTELCISSIISTGKVLYFTVDLLFTNTTKRGVHMRYLDTFFAWLVRSYGYVFDKGKTLNEDCRERHPIPAGAILLYPFAKRSHFFFTASELFLRSPKLRENPDRADFLLKTCTTRKNWWIAIDIAPFASRECQEFLLHTFILEGMHPEADRACRILGRLFTKDEWNTLSDRMSTRGRFCDTEYQSEHPLKRKVWVKKKPIARPLPSPLSQKTKGVEKELDLFSHH
jgi:hypothetical protein